MRRPRYLVAALLIFCVEVFIARFMHDSVIRPFVGDVLVVVLIYAVLRALLPLHPRRLALLVLLFSCTVEILQYFDYVALLHLEHNRILSVIMGRTFSWTDFLAYFTGWLIVLQDREGHPAFPNSFS